MAKEKKIIAPSAFTPAILSGAELRVTDETVEVTLTNPEDPLEKATFVQRKHKAAAFIVNDMTAKISADTKQIKPFEG